MKSSHSIKQKVTEATEIPKDVIMGAPVLSVTGVSELNLENHNGIIEYTDSIIRIRTRAGQLRVNGKKLNIDYYTNDEIRMHGRIDSIEFRH